jgi:hypothetical protein
MDCEGGNPRGSSAVCLNLLNRYAIHTRQMIPCARVECPCWSPADVDTLLSECDGDGLSVTCSDLLLQGQGALFITEMKCSEERGPVEIGHYLRAEIDARIQIIATCDSENVPPLLNAKAIITDDQARACSQILRDRFDDCDTVRMSR